MGKLVGKSMLFRVTISEDNVKRIKSSYVVDRYSDDCDMVEEFIRQNDSQVCVLYFWCFYILFSVLLNKNVFPQAPITVDANEDNSDVPLEPVKTPTLKRGGAEADDSLVIDVTSAKKKKKGVGTASAHARMSDKSGMD